jgi:type II secretory pathway pseudopilin PulG
MTRRCPNRAPTGEAGFTIIETIAGAVITVIIVVALGQALSVAMGGARDNRFRQDAVAVALSELEAARAVTWEELALTEVDATAPLLADSGVALDAAPLGLPADEGLVVTADGTIAPRVEEVVEGVLYTVWRYVSLPDRDTRRMTIEITWTDDGRDHSFVTSTLLSDASADEIGVSGG